MTRARACARRGHPEERKRRGIPSDPGQLITARLRGARHPEGAATRDPELLSSPRLCPLFATLYGKAFAIPRRPGLTFSHAIDPGDRAAGHCRAHGRRCGLRVGSQAVRGARRLPRPPFRPRTSARSPPPRPSSISAAKPPSPAISSARGIASAGPSTRCDRRRARRLRTPSSLFRSRCTKASSGTKRSPGRPRKPGPRADEIDPEIEAQIEAPETNPEAIATAREAVASDRPAAVPDVPIVVNDSVLRVIAAFQSDALHDKIQAGLVRSGRYLPMIHQVFAEEGLPQDLAMIAFIESSFLPLARSNKMAHGIWQFMPRTGRQYGLRSNGLVDERRDFEKSTRAAARYLAYLNEIFGDWYLAMAAYNAGEGKILRAMNRTGARDFWHLASTNAIRKQTKNYVPAFLASVLISKNPSHYGFVVVRGCAARVRHGPPGAFDQPRGPFEGVAVSARGPPVAQPRAADSGHAAAARGLRPPDSGRDARDAIARRRRRSHDAPAGVQDARREEGRHASQARPTLRRDGLLSGVGELALDTRTAVPRPGNHGSREGQEDREGLDSQSRRREVEEDDEVRTPGAGGREELPREDRGHPLPDRPPARNDRGRDPGHQRPRRLRADQAGGQAQDPGASDRAAALGGRSGQPEARSAEGSRHSRLSSPATMPPSSSSSDQASSAPRRWHAHPDPLRRDSRPRSACARHRGRRLGRFPPLHDRRTPRRRRPRSPRARPLRPEELGLRVSIGDGHGQPGPGGLSKIRRRARSAGRPGPRRARR